MADRGISIWIDSSIINSFVAAESVNSIMEQSVGISVELSAHSSNHDEIDEVQSPLEITARNAALSTGPCLRSR